MLVKTFKKQLNPQLRGENCICLPAKLLLLNMPSHWMPRHNGDLIVFVQLCVSRKSNKTPPKTKQFLDYGSDHFLVYYFVALFSSLS